MDFRLEVLNLGIVKPRNDLISHKTPTYDFMSELDLRVREREESFHRGISCEPIVVNKCGFELMDGYTRYMILKRHKQEKVMAYVGIADKR